MARYLGPHHGGSLRLRHPFTGGNNRFRAVSSFHRPDDLLEAARRCEASLLKELAAEGGLTQGRHPAAPPGSQPSTAPPWVKGSVE